MIQALLILFKCILFIRICIKKQFPQNNDWLVVKYSRVNEGEIQSWSFFSCLYALWFACLCIKSMMKMYNSYSKITIIMKMAYVGNHTKL